MWSIFSYCRCWGHLGVQYSKNQRKELRSHRGSSIPSLCVLTCGITSHTKNSPCFCFNFIPNPLWVFWTVYLLSAKPWMLKTQDKTPPKPMEGNAAWCCKVFSGNILGAGSKALYCPEGSQGAAVQAQSPPVCWEGFEDPLTGGYKLAECYGWFIVVSLAEVNHGCWTGWDARNRALKTVRKKKTHSKRGHKNNTHVSFMGGTSEETSVGIL